MGILIVIEMGLLVSSQILEKLWQFFDLRGKILLLVQFQFWSLELVKLSREVWVCSNERSRPGGAARALSYALRKRFDCFWSRI